MNRRRQLCGPWGAALWSVLLLEVGPGGSAQEASRPPPTGSKDSHGGQWDATGLCWVCAHSPAGLRFTISMSDRRWGWEGVPRREHTGRAAAPCGHKSCSSSVTQPLAQTAAGRSQEVRPNLLLKTGVPHLQAQIRGGARQVSPAPTTHQAEHPHTSLGEGDLAWTSASAATLSRRS